MSRPSLERTERLGPFKWTLIASGMRRGKVSLTRQGGPGDPFDLDPVERKAHGPVDIREGLLIVCFVREPNSHISLALGTDESCPLSVVIGSVGRTVTFREASVSGVLYCFEMETGLSGAPGGGHEDEPMFRCRWDAVSSGVRGTYCVKVPQTPTLCLYAVALCTHHSGFVLS